MLVYSVNDPIIVPGVATNKLNSFSEAIDFCFSVSAAHDEAVCEIVVFGEFFDDTVDLEG